MPSNKHRSQKWTDTEKEEQVAQAVREAREAQATRVAASKGKPAVTLEEVAEKHGVPVSTLGHRVNGRQSRRQAHERQQKLTNAQEEALVQWVIFRGAMGNPMSKEEIRSYANTILGGRDTVGHICKIQNSR
ncbi:hypothetical protein FRC12_016258 [Ceratobasidium sp. 428]|nr:hypothetical protein FRC12_016258 [Ceratobasidium sp. 428]